MSGATRALDELGADQPQALGAQATDPLERALESEPCWPITRLVASSLTLVLGVAVLTPTAIIETHRLEWLALLLPAIVATLSARAMFEAVGAAIRRRSLLGAHNAAGYALAALAPALLAVAVMAGASTIAGTGFGPAAGGATLALALAALTIAGTVRDVEIRVRLSLRRVYFVGTTESRRDLERELSRRRDASLVGAALLDGPAARPDVGPAARAAHATVVVLDADAMRRPELVDAAAQLNLAGVHIRDLVSYYESEFKKVPLGELSPTWFLFDIAPIHRRRVYRALRRGLELALAGGLLALSVPVLALSMLATKLTSPGPALYRQRRVGKGGAEFTLVKLRTMAPTTVSTAAWAGAEANRITHVGRFLRRFRLDELPQLWSVIRGDLALIGPRPEQVAIAERLDRELPHYNARHCIRPGITGWAQVNLGYAGSVEGTVAKLQRDLYYVKHSSLRLDGLILWLTFKTVIAGRG
jgi:lipopolysaccharide/colanic/teichoic acid biosynthesis glycosyltransferase